MLGWNFVERRVEKQMNTGARSVHMRTVEDCAGETLGTQEVHSRSLLLRTAAAAQPSHEHACCALVIALANKRPPRLASVLGQHLQIYAVVAAARPLPAVNQ